MNTQTLRNLLLSMVVLGIAGSVVGVGTFAQFNAVTTSQSNTFSSAAITFSSTNNGGTCTSTAGATGTGFCTGSTSFTIQGATFVPGDSKTATTTLTNGGNVKAKVDLAISETGSTNNLSNIGIGTALGSTAAGTRGLGLLIFQCQNASGDIACASATKLVTIYGSCGTTSGGTTNAGTNSTLNMSATGFSSSNINTTSVVDNSVNVTSVTSVNISGAAATTTTATTAVCYGGDIGTTAGTGVAGAAIPIVNSATNTAPMVGGVSPMPFTGTNSTDHLGLVVYLPYIADNTVQNIVAPNLTFTWTATQIAGASS